MLMSLEVFLREVNVIKLTDIEKKKLLAIKVGLAVQSAEELLSRHPQANFYKTIFDDLETYIDIKNELAYFYCSSCELYINDLLEDDASLEKWFHKEKITTKHYCPICKEYIGEMITIHPIY